MINFTLRCFLQLLKGLAKLESYNTVSFPHCPCDARKNGHIIVSMNMAGVTIQACSDKGVPEVPPCVCVV